MELGGKEIFSQAKELSSNFMSQFFSEEGELTGEAGELSSGFSDLISGGMMDMLKEFLPEELQGLMDLDGLPEMSDTESTTQTVDTAAGNVPGTETGNFVETQAGLATNQSSQNINNPALENGGVNRSQSTIPAPAASPMNAIQNSVAAINSPPANRVQFV